MYPTSSACDAIIKIKIKLALTVEDCNYSNFRVLCESAVYSAHKKESAASGLVSIIRISLVPQTPENSNFLFIAVL